MSTKPIDDDINIINHVMQLISNVIDARGYTQSEAAEILGISQPKISHIRKQTPKIFNLYSLLGMLNKLGFDVNIVVHKSKSRIGKIYAK